MTSIVLSDVTTKNSLKTFATENDLIKTLSDEIKTQFPNYQQLVNSLELIDWICTHIENAIPKGNSKTKFPVNKKDVVKKILTLLIPGFDSNLIEKQIEYLISNELISKIPLATKYFKSITGFFLKKLSP
jgi:hypothetical protein